MTFLVFNYLQMQIAPIRIGITLGSVLRGGGRTEPFRQISGLAPEEAGAALKGPEPQAGR